MEQRMRESTIRFAWREPSASGEFGTGVCVHGHTLHSREFLSFLPRYLRGVPGLAPLVNHYERGPDHVDFSRAWWTPPLTPASALNLEREQIAGLGLRPIVSLTDHDDIQAGLTLGVTRLPLRRRQAGVFPMVGVPTLLCLLAAVGLRLNPVALQRVNNISSPLQWALLLPLERTGAH